MKRKINLILATLLPVQIISVQVLAKHPEFIERVYSQNLYLKISKVQQIIFSFFPFSIGDLFYAGLIIALIIWVYKRFKTKFSQIKQWSLQTLAVLSLGYFLFHFLWGLNYYRVPLNENLGLDRNYQYEDLLSLTDHLIQKTNQLQEQLSKDKSTAVNFHFSYEDINLKSNQSIDLVNFNHPNIKYNSKKSLFSFPLTYMGFSGYLNPFTHEAHLNSLLPDFKLPTLATHEMAHQIGYAKENEANFIAVLSTINHSDLYFNYAGYTFALQYCLGDIAKKDKNKAKKLLENLNPGVRKNYKEVQDFWKKHENPFEPAFKLFYKNFLKVNNQPEGMQSYNYVVGLLVNYYKKEEKL